VERRVMNNRNDSGAALAGLVFAALALLLMVLA
jgi:hypothetical protein